MDAHGRGNHTRGELPGSASVRSAAQSKFPGCGKDGGVHKSQRVSVTGSGDRHHHRRDVS